VALAAGLAEGLDVAFGVDLEFFLTAVPLFQTSFVPDLTQKCFRPPEVFVVPTLVHLVPAIVAACAGTENAERNTATRRTLE
jgi:hypothetical protein